MKFSLTLTILLISFVLTSKSQSVGIGTNAPDTSAILDVVSNTRGFLPPRVLLDSINSPAPILHPAKGLLVYNTTTSGAFPLNVRPGYYYWSGSSWVSVINSGNAFGDMQYWDGTKWILIPIGTEGQVLTICGGVPRWGSCQTVLTLQPANNPYELNYNSYNPDQVANIGLQLTAQAWTAFGSPLTSRQIMKFDFSSIPSGSTIDSAKLFLYSVDAPAGGNLVNAQDGNANACYIRRIISSWSLPSSFSWNNPPSATAVNQVEIPQSLTTADDNIVYVTQLVNDMMVNGNNGFLIQLQNELPYNIRQYTSSHNADVEEHPKLVIYYH